VADNKWTKEQQSAIDLLGRRLLVSAAAGSGKTAVLVERIISRILDPKEPVDVDRLLVVTFTKAAAGEMKDRIRSRLVLELEKTSDPRLAEQISILDSASIQTIDSFCMDVVREHPDELNIDPNVRVADEAELKLMRADVMEALLEDNYEKAEDDFINFVEAYGQGTAGNGIEDRIFQVYDFAKVTADPESWYDSQIDNEDTQKYTTYIFDTLRSLIGSYAQQLEELIAICNRPLGPKGYINTLEQDLEFIDNVSYAKDYDELSQILNEYSWPTIGRKSKTDDEVLVELVKERRNKEIKDVIKAYTKDYTRQDKDELIKEHELTADFIKVLIGLARDFDLRFTEEKNRKNIIDFNDLEHLALKALKDDPEYGSRFDEIYVDEYQDTNDIQEAIIKCLDNGRVFMVGDVKQSIYGFRQARPEIFMEKYDRFKTLNCVADKENADRENAGKESADTDTEDTVILLAKNFRSRPQVLDSVNGLFSRIMRKELGGVEYTKDVALYEGAEFGELESAEEKVDAGEDCAKDADKVCAGNYDTEILLVNVSDLDEDNSARELEARMIAQKIRQLVDPSTGIRVWDKDEKKYHAANYRDIVILLRSANAVGDIYIDALQNAGIPAHCDTNKGYFDSLEIRTIVSMLAAIDNPRKDIPMAAFLHSPIINMSDDELAVYKRNENKLSDLGKYKLEKARVMLERYSGMSRYMDIADLITSIYDETGYYEYACTLPGGATRKANLDKLRRMASEYASTGFKGLFNFIRYIDNLKTYDTDFGEASFFGEHDDAVRIMSIHKSKGLEFPVVFLAACDKKLNQMDSNQNILVDEKLGVGCLYINTAERYKQKTIRQMALRIKSRTDTMGEELRVLYVAMTRAKEKLFITGAIKDEDKFITSYEDAIKRKERDPNNSLPLSVLRSDKGFLYWIVSSGVGYPYSIIDPGDEISETAFVRSDSIRKYLNSLTVDPALSGEYDNIFQYKYPYLLDVDLMNKISISELKKRWAMEAEKTDEVQVVDSSVGDSFVYINRDEKNSGAMRGTIYHEVMEKLDFSKGVPIEIPMEVKREDIQTFIESDIGREFRKAQEEGRLYREHQFIMGVPASELKLADSSEPVLVQGIIDAFYETDEGLILLDYKTDRVSSGQELVDRYEGQLYYYAMALEKLRAKPVIRKCIWSFALGKLIEI